MPLDALPQGSGKGTYLLTLRLSESQPITIGRLGTWTLPIGWYVYVGSAFGSGGLRGRLRHHLTPVRRPHWHIDYLRQAAPVIAIAYAFADHSVEHEWAAALHAFPDARIPIPRFGASDCRCDAHLFHFDAAPNLGGLASVNVSIAQI